MTKPFTAEVSIVVNASASKVWQALIDPALIKQYLFGTEAVSDWKVGSPIIYKGTWEGKSYEDKGVILELEPQKKLVSTYWSSMTGLPDTPENYQTVAYTLAPQDGGTKLTITQTNAASQESADHSGDNWKMVLDGLKKVVEKN